MATYFGQQTQNSSDDQGALSKIQLGVYSSDGSSLIAVGTGQITVSGTSFSWQGHMTQASVKAAGGVSPGVLVGGTDYKLAWYSTDNSGSNHILFWTYGTVNCPGSGNQNIQELSAYCSYPSSDLTQGTNSGAAGDPYNFSSPYDSGLPSALPTPDGYSTRGGYDMRCGVDPAGAAVQPYQPWMQMGPILAQ